MMQNFNTVGRPFERGWQSLCTLLTFEGSFEGGNDLSTRN